MEAHTYRTHGEIEVFCNALSAAGAPFAALAGDPEEPDSGRDAKIQNFHDKLHYLLACAVCGALARACETEEIPPVLDVDWRPGGVTMCLYNGDEGKFDEIEQILALLTAFKKLDELNASDSGYSEVQSALRSLLGAQ